LNLLWAAYGINRPEIGKPTIPSALNWQEIDLYVSMASHIKPQWAASKDTRNSGR
jgi:hypothetical protein